MRIAVDLSDAFTLMSVIGLATIVDGEAVGTRVHWETSQSAIVEAEALSDADIAALVHEHAAARSTDSWITRVFPLDDKPRAVLSPRIGIPKNDQSWRELQNERHNAIDSVPAEARGDRRFIGALGEPAYWAADREKTYVDYGASAWEMKTRNRGEEFLQNRLSLLAASVAGRSVEEVLEGLVGRSVRDEVGKGASSSRTPTGLRAPHVADNALAWCALWGISLFPIRPVPPAQNRVPIRSHTAGVVHVKGDATWFGIPVFDRPTSVARVRAVARSAALTTVIRTYATAERELGARAFLARHGVVEVRAFRQFKTDNVNAPEPWLLSGMPVSIGMSV